MEHVAFQNWPRSVLCFGVGFVSCFGLVPLILKWIPASLAGRRSRDLHHTHALPMVRLGGCALAISFVLVVLFILGCGDLSAADTRTLGIITMGTVAMLALGIWDDVVSCPATIKLAAQTLIAGGTWLGGIQIEVLRNPFTGSDISLGTFGFVVTIGWLVAVTNLINIIDGIDGLAGGICLMLMGLLANLGLGGGSGFCLLLPIGVAGALLAFLKFNYPPARIYMGDGGAYFLGFLIGALSIANAHKGTVGAALIAPALALALPIADGGLALLRRGLRGLPVFRPDQRHIHHYLIAVGFSPEGAVLILYGISSFCLFLAFTVFWSQGRLLPLLAGMLCLVIVVVGHLSGLSRDWRKVGRRFASAMRQRKRTRYILLLTQWLEMESERHASLDELWADFAFIAKRFDLARAELVRPDGIKLWEVDDLAGRTRNLLHVSHPLGDGSILELSGDRRIVEEDSFQLLADLTAEAWQKASTRWRIPPPNPTAMATDLKISEIVSAESLSTILGRMHDPAKCHSAPNL